MYLPNRDLRTGRFVSKDFAQSSEFIKVQAEIQARLDRVAAAAAKAAFENLRHAIASIAKDARESIKRSKKPSVAGDPPHTRKGLFRRAIRYHATKDSAVAGPRYSVAGESGAAHEFGGRYKGDVFEERPFMEPALRKAAPRFAGSWRGSIGE